MATVDTKAEAVEIVVMGRPQPGGSKTAIPMKRAGRYLTDTTGRPLVQVVDANPKAKGWRQAVTKAANRQYGGTLLSGPMIVSIEFYLHRWKGHFGTGRNARLLKPDAPLYPAGDHPDADKLARPVLDGLSGSVYDDDALVVDLVVQRRYAEGYSHKDDGGTERAVVRVMQHVYRTFGERTAASQQELVLTSVVDGP